MPAMKSLLTVSMTSLTLIFSLALISCSEQSEKTELDNTADPYAIVGKSLDSVFGAIGTAEVKSGDMAKTRSSKEITDAAEIKSITDAINLNQPLSSRAARCLLSYSIDLSDKSGKEIGTIGVCQSTNAKASQHAVFIQPHTVGGSMPRLGLTIADATALNAALGAKLAH